MRAGERDHLAGEEAIVQVRRDRHAELAARLSQQLAHAALSLAQLSHCPGGVLVEDTPGWSERGLPGFPDQEHRAQLAFQPKLGPAHRGRWYPELLRGG